MTLKYPDVCPQSVLDSWWEEDSNFDFKAGRLIWSFIPHVDQVPYTLEPIGRDNSEEHDTGIVRTKAFKVGPRAKKMDLPVAAMPIRDNEIFCVYRAKKRPAIIISDGGTYVKPSLRIQGAPWRTNRTILVAPSYSVKPGVPAKLISRIQSCEYPQFLWDFLPIGGAEFGSMIRLDHLQPVGRNKKSVQFTKYCLSEKAMEIIWSWVDWLFLGKMNEDSDFCKMREFLMLIFDSCFFIS